MPSWNIHTAHVEHLFASELPSSLGISNTNEFLFGNLAPDVYVGYVVKDITKKIEYKDTHLADPGFIPTPDAALFFERYIQGKEPSDLTLGAWTHLICDHYYNLRTIEYIASIGVEAGTQTRIRKQADFDLYGRTFDISSVLEPTDELLRSCERFPQYAIERSDALAAIEAQRAIVDRNQNDHVVGTPAYDLLTPAFFSSTFNEVDTLLREALHAFMQSNAPTDIGRVAHGVD